ncbi:hypothetical protein EJ02DRAFT_426149 [Clathrospora elynae]|uniref:Uncharacterized protein n=1 Tax=Clathrospora elynae TaxID=706981 RepID=A0A6A5SHG5_9PLEO|nr:hypothetical protein EJ02DRAFT_426149 [Clathrospora elynae]
MSECLHQLHQFQPWAQQVESHIQENHCDLTNLYNALPNKWGAINRAYAKFEDPRICQAGNLKDGKLYYPVDKRRTRDTVTAMVTAEAALEAFWKLANANWLHHCGTTLPLSSSISSSFESKHVLPGAKAVPHALLNCSHETSKQITGTFDRLVVASKSKKH